MFGYFLTTYLYNHTTTGVVLMTKTIELQIWVVKLLYLQIVAGLIFVTDSLAILENLGIKLFLQIERSHLKVLGYITRKPSGRLFLELCQQHSLI